MPTLILVLLPLLVAGDPIRPLSLPTRAWFWIKVRSLRLWYCINLVMVVLLVCRYFCFDLNMVFGGLWWKLANTLTYVCQFSITSVFYMVMLPADLVHNASSTWFISWAETQQAAQVNDCSHCVFFTSSLILIFPLFSGTIWINAFLKWTHSKEFSPGSLKVQEEISVPVALCSWWRLFSYLQQLERLILKGERLLFYFLVKTKRSTSGQTPE